MKIAINIELTDQTGKGNKDIVKAYGPGAFELCDSFLTVRIPYNPLALDSPLSDGGGVSGGEAENDDLAAILSLISESSGATTVDIVSGTGIPKRTVERRLASLKKEKRIVRVGSDKNGHGELPGGSGDGK